MSKYFPTLFDIATKARGYRKEEVDKFLKHPRSRIASARGDKLLFGDGRIKFISEYTLKIKRNLIAVSVLNLFINISGEIPTKIVAFEINLTNHTDMLMYFLLGINVYYLVYFYYSYTRDYYLSTEELSRVLYHEITDEQDFADPKHGWMGMCNEVAKYMMPNPWWGFPLSHIGIIEVILPVIISSITLIYSLNKLGII